MNSPFPTDLKNNLAFYPCQMVKLVKILALLKPLHESGN